jgi:DNA-binding MarR family transcriptional regulator
MSDDTGPGPHYPALLQLLRTAETIWNSSRLFFGRWDLSPAQFNLLNLLTDQPEGLSQSDLSRELLTHRSNITGLVDRLEKRELVRRRELVDDRRAWRVVLTRGGQELMEEILPHYYRAAEVVWSGVSVRRATEVAAVLQVVAENTERASRSLPEVRA